MSEKNIKQNLLKKRKGKFQVSIKLLESIEPGFLKPFIIYQANTNYLKGVVEYYATSYLFDVLQESEKIPMYEIKAESDPDSNLIWQADRIRDV